MRPFLVCVLAALIALGVWLSFDRSGDSVGPRERPDERTAVETRGLELADDPRAVERADAAHVDEAPPARMLREDDPMALLRVRVVDRETREAIAGAKITYYANAQAPDVEGASNGWELVDTATTDADGRVMHMITPGLHVQCTAFAHQRAGKRIEPPLQRGEERDVEIELGVTPDLALCGRVLARETNAPIVGTVVSTDPDEVAVAVGPDGSFRARMRSWIDEGLHVRAPGYGPRRIARATGHETADRAVVVLLERSAALRVVVLDHAGAPLANARAILDVDDRDLAPDPARASSRGTTTWSAATDVEGVATWSDLPAGIPLLGRVESFGARLHVEPAPIVLQQAERRELVWTLPPVSRIQGLVVEEDGTPAPKQELWLEPALHDLPTILRSEARGRRTARTDGDGRFTFTRVTPGRWWIAPAEPHFGDKDVARDPVPRAQVVDVADTGGDVDVVVRLQRGLVVRGRVLAPDGRGVPNGTVIARRRGTQEVVSTGSLAEDGAFVLGPLAPGPWIVGASTFLAYRPSEDVEVEAGAANVVLHLRRACELRVRVLGDDGIGVASVRVHVETPTRNGYSITTDARGTTSSTNWFAETVASIGCSTADGRWARATGVQLAYERAADVDLRLERGVVARLRCVSSPPANSVSIVHDGTTIAIATLEHGRATPVTLPIGRSVLRWHVRGAGFVEHEFVVAAGTEPELTYDGAWR